MFELDQIFTEPLAAKVFLDLSAVFLAAFAIVAMWAWNSRDRASVRQFAGHAHDARAARSAA